MTEPLFDDSAYDSSTRIEITQGLWTIIHGLVVESTYTNIEEFTESEND